MLTFFTSLGLGALSMAGASIIASSVWLAGSILTQGNIHYDPTVNTAPTQYYGSGSFLSYKETRITTSGSNVLVANIQIPTTFASGAILQMASVECGLAPFGQSGSIVLQTGTKQSRSTGVLVRHRITMGTGSSVLTATGGNALGKVPSDGYINFISNVNTITTPNDCKFKVWFHEKYGK